MFMYQEYEIKIIIIILNYITLEVRLSYVLFESSLLHLIGLLNDFSYCTGLRKTYFGEIISIVFLLSNNQLNLQHLHNKQVFEKIKWIFLQYHIF